MTAAIILAGGASVRMGSPKASLPFRGGTFLSHLADRLALHCHPVIVVLGAHAETIKRSSPANFVINREWPEGQLSSLQCGLRALPTGSESALFTLVDHPDPQDSTIARLLHSSYQIAIPVYQGRRGHPVVVRSQLLPELLALSPRGSAKDVLRRYAAETEYINVEDPAVTDDIDDPAALASFRRRTSGMSGQS